MKVKDLEKLAKEIIQELDSIASDYDNYEYCLPTLNSDVMAHMKLAIIKLIDEAREEKL